MRIVLDVDAPVRAFRSTSVPARGECAWSDGYEDPTPPRHELHVPITHGKTPRQLRCTHGIAPPLAQQPTVPNGSFTKGNIRVHCTMRKNRAPCRMCTPSSACVHRLEKSFAMRNRCDDALHERAPDRTNSRRQHDVRPRRAPIRIRGGSSIRKFLILASALYPTAIRRMHHQLKSTSLNPNEAHRPTHTQLGVVYTPPPIPDARKRRILPGRGKRKPLA